MVDRCEIRPLRLMKRMVKTVRAHAQKHRDLLDQEWAQTDWTRPQADQVIRRLDAVLAPLPETEKQVHERIIGERPVANDEKVISFYETDTKVIVRGKVGAEVEFGNTLRLGETPQGSIVDWQLFQDSAPSDSAPLQDSVEQVERTLQRKLKGVSPKKVGVRQAVAIPTAQRGLRFAEHDLLPLERLHMVVAKHHVQFAVMPISHPIG